MGAWDSVSENGEVWAGRNPRLGNYIPPSAKQIIWEKQGKAKKAQQSV